MSFVYPRTVSILRQAAQIGFGALPPSGAGLAPEQAIATGLPASIQQKSTGAKPDAGLPGDATNRTFWRVFIPRGQLALGAVQRGDIVVDDLGQRYHVTAPYWNSLGHNLLVERLEA